MGKPHEKWEWVRNEEGDFWLGRQLGSSPRYQVQVRKVKTDDQGTIKWAYTILMRRLEGLQLLHACREIFIEKGTDFIPEEELAEALNNRKDPDLFYFSPSFYETADEAMKAVEELYDDKGMLKGAKRIWQEAFNVRQAAASLLDFYRVAAKLERGKEVDRVYLKAAHQWRNGGA
jgi:hypothetical protein